MRKPVIAGNWKMYKLLGEAVDTALALKPLVANANHCEVVIAPVFTALKTVADRLEGSNIKCCGTGLCDAERIWGAHRRGCSGDAQGRWMLARNHRPQRAAAVLWRDGRVGQSRRQRRHYRQA